MPRLEYDVVFNLDQSSTETLEKNLNRLGKSGGLEKTKNDAEELSNTLLTASNRAERFSQDLSESGAQISRFQNNTDEAKRALQGFQQSSRQAGKDTKNMSKIANNSNQILFSFGDAIQDGAQFQHGFASGARAVGNNLTFASEQISIAIEKTGSFSAAMRSMGSALMGPAGAILLINGLVTAFTVLPNIVGESTEEVTAFKDELSSANSELEEFLLQRRGLSDQDDILSTEEERAALEGQLRNQEAILERARELRRERAKREAGRILPGISEDREGLSDVNKLIATTEKRIADLRQQIRAQELLQTTPLALEEKIKRARESVETAFESQDDVIIPAEIDTGGLDDVGQQFRAFLGSGVFDIAIPTVGEQLISPSDLEDRINQARKSFQKLRDDEGFTIATQQARSRLDNLLSLQQQRSQQVINGLRKTGVETNKSLIDVATTGASTADMQAENARKNIKKISTVAGIAGQAVTALFGKGKDAAIASAIVNGAQAITRTFAEYGFTPFGIGAAAAQAAVTAAQISKIKSTEPGSSGGGGGSAGGFRSEGFNVGSIERSGRPSPNPDTAMNQNNGSAPINVDIRTEADSRIISKKATQGRKRIDSNTTVKVRSEA